MTIKDSLSLCPTTCCNCFSRCWAPVSEAAKCTTATSTSPRVPTDTLPITAGHPTLTATLFTAKPLRTYKCTKPACASAAPTKSYMLSICGKASGRAHSCNPTTSAFQRLSSSCTAAILSSAVKPAGAWDDTVPAFTFQVNNRSGWKSDTATRFTLTGATLKSASFPSSATAPTSALSVTSSSSKSRHAPSVTRECKTSRDIPPSPPARRDAKALRRAALICPTKQIERGSGHFDGPPA